MGDWAAAPAPPAFGDGRGCRACGRADELETEQHLCGAESAVVAAASTLIVCDCCESEYHVSCLQPPIAAVPEGEWICPECAIAGRLPPTAAATAAGGAASAGRGRGIRGLGRGRGSRGGGGVASPGRGGRGGGRPMGSGGRGSGGSAVAGLDPLDGEAYVSVHAAVAAVGSALSGPVRGVLAAHSSVAMLDGDDAGAAAGAGDAGAAAFGTNGLRGSSSSGGGGSGGGDEVAEPPAAHILTSQPGSEPPPDGAPYLVPAPARVAFSDVGVLGRFMQVSAEQVRAAAAGAPLLSASSGPSERAAPAPASTVAPLASAPAGASQRPVLAGGRQLSAVAPVPQTARGLAATAPAKAPATASAPVLAAINLDAPPGLGGSPIEGSTCLAVCPPEARALWRLAALLAEHDPRQLPAAVRARLLLELVTIVADVGHIAAHLESLAEAFTRGQRELRKLIDSRPPETRAAALARAGIPMPIVVRARREELRRVRFAGGAGWLAVRPPPYVRELARLLVNPSAARPITVQVVDAVGLRWARAEITADEKQSAKAGAKRLLTDGSSGGSAKESPAPAPRSFIRRVCYGRAPSASGAAGAAGGSAASSAPSERRTLNTFSQFTAPRPRPAAPRRSSPLGARPAAGLTGAWARLPGPFPNVSFSAARALSALCGTLPRPANEAAIVPPPIPSQHMLDSSRGKLYIPTALRGVSLCVISNFARDAIEDSGLGPAGGVCCQARIQIGGGTRAVYFHTDFVRCGRAYDLCALAMRGASAAKALNFPDDIEAYADVLVKVRAGLVGERRGPLAVHLTASGVASLLCSGLLSSRPKPLESQQPRKALQPAVALPVTRCSPRLLLPRRLARSWRGAGHLRGGCPRAECRCPPRLRAALQTGTTRKTTRAVTAQAARGRTPVGLTRTPRGACRRPTVLVSPCWNLGFKLLFGCVASCKEGDYKTDADCAFPSPLPRLSCAVQSQPDQFVGWATGITPAALQSVAATATGPPPPPAGSKRPREANAEADGAAAAAAPEASATAEAALSGGVASAAHLLLSEDSPAAEPKRPRLVLPAAAGEALSVPAPTSIPGGAPDASPPPVSEGAAAATDARSALGQQQGGVPPTAPVTALFPAELAFTPQDLFQASGAGPGRLGGADAAAPPPAAASGDRPATADVDLSPPEGELWMVGPEEPDAGHPAADRALLPSERGLLLVGAAELAWREAARAAYAPKWSGEVRARRARRCPARPPRRAPRAGVGGPRAGRRRGVRGRPVPRSGRCGPAASRPLHAPPHGPPSFCAQASCPRARGCPCSAASAASTRLARRTSCARPTTSSARRSRTSGETSWCARGPGGGGRTRGRTR